MQMIRKVIPVITENLNRSKNKELRCPTIRPKPLLMLWWASFQFLLCVYTLR